ncbi:MAG: putative Ig domain-containing protein, partial [Candidatus Sulfotelmatobacter sp.]
ILLLTCGWLAIASGCSMIGLDQSPASGIQVAVSPSTATLTPAAQQQFSATVQGTSNSAVTWSASAGSITKDGVFTAPAANQGIQITVTATSVTDPTQHAASLVTIQNASQLAIATSSLSGAVVDTPYDGTLAASGGTPPYHWKISAGFLAPGIQLRGTTGALAGITSYPGQYSFTVKVADSASHSASQSLTLAVAAATNSNFDGPAELPRAYLSTTLADTPAPGSTTMVKAGGDLQGALDNASCGDTIELQAGATFTAGQYTLPAKVCDDQHWIIVRTSAPDSSLPPEGTRMTPCYAGVTSLPGRPALNCSSTQNVLAKIVYWGAGDGPIILAAGANHYRLLGLEITRAPGTGSVGALLSSKGGEADHVVADRIWLHGTRVDDTVVGFSVNGMTNAAIVDSYLNDFHCTSIVGTCTDAHAVSGGLGSLTGGPYKIVDNFLEASGENILFGGGAATTTPADIQIQGNHLFKPLIWQQGRTGFIGGKDGYPFTVKNHFELKNAQRVLFEGNILENNWGGFTQEGHSILLCPKNQHTADGNVCPLCQVTDVTVRYSTISHVGGGMKMGTSISASGAGGQALAGARWSVHDVTIDDVNGAAYRGSGNLLMIANGWTTNVLNNVMINHVTGFTDPANTLLFAFDAVSNPPISGVTITNNIFATGRYPVWSTGGGSISCAYSDTPITIFARCFNVYIFNYNALIGSPTNFPPSLWPAANLFPASTDNVGFVNYNNGSGGNYALLPSSPYKNAGNDGKDLGADIAAIQAAIAGAY